MYCSKLNLFLYPEFLIMSLTRDKGIQIYNIFLLKNINM